MNSRWILLCFGLLFIQMLHGQGRTSPVLIYPIEGEKVYEMGPLRFQWTVSTPQLGSEQVSQLQVVEVLSGQSVAQAIRSNPPLIDETVIGQTFYLLQPQDIPLPAGGSMHLAWHLVARPDLQGSIFHPENSEPGDFWLYDALTEVSLGNPVQNADCGIVDAGEDQVIDEQNETVMLGPEAEYMYRYEWMADPPEDRWSSVQYRYRAYQSRIRVSPAQTTRYVIFRTDTSTNCTVSDEVWVVVNKPISVWIEVDPCGVLTARVGYKNEADPGAGRSSDSSYYDEIAYYHTGLPKAGLTRWTSVKGLSDNVMPPRPEKLPYAMAEYLWSTGERTPSIRPAPGATKDFFVTVTMGAFVASARIQFAPHACYQGEFPELLAPREVKLGNSVGNLGFRIWDYELLQASAAIDPITGAQVNPSRKPYNAISYRLVVLGPQNYVWIKEGYTLSGFENGEIYWDQVPDLRGHAPMTGRYHYRLTLRNCDYPNNDIEQMLRVRNCPNGGELDNVSRPGRILSGSFEVK